MEAPKRPNTKGYISRRFRVSSAIVTIIHSKTEQKREVRLETILNEPIPEAYARYSVRLEPGEMVLRVDITRDEYVIVTMTPEEFFFRGATKPFINLLQNQDHKGDQS